MRTRIYNARILTMEEKRPVFKGEIYIDGGKAQNREAMIYEASDLVYHLLVLLEATGCSIADLEKELARRHS